MTVANFIGFLVLLCVLGLLAILIVATAGAAAAWLYGVALGLLGKSSPIRSPDAPYRPTRPQVPPALRRRALERDEFRCVICGNPQELELDHEIPLSKGGATSLENLRVLCHSCNQLKGAS